jgi:hypothetical protein
MNVFGSTRHNCSFSDLLLHHCYPHCFLWCHLLRAILVFHVFFHGFVYLALSGTGIFSYARIPDSFDYPKVESFAQRSLENSCDASNSQYHYDVENHFTASSSWHVTVSLSNSCRNLPHCL